MESVSGAQYASCREHAEPHARSPAARFFPAPISTYLGFLHSCTLSARYCRALTCSARVLGLKVVPACCHQRHVLFECWFFLYSNNQFSRSYIFLPCSVPPGGACAPLAGLWPVLGLPCCRCPNIDIRKRPSSSSVRLLYTAWSRLNSDGMMPFASDRSTRWRRLPGCAAGLALLLLFVQYEPLSFNLHKSGSGSGFSGRPTVGPLQLDCAILASLRHHSRRGARG